MQEPASVVGRRVLGEEDRVKARRIRWKKEGEKVAYTCGIKGTAEQFVHVTKRGGASYAKGD